MPAEVAFRGSIDGTRPVRTAGVRFRQAQRDALFAIDSPFASLRLGPTNFAPLRLRKGGEPAAEYAIIVPGRRRTA